MLIGGGIIYVIVWGGDNFFLDGQFHHTFHMFAAMIWYYSPQDGTGE
jgi:hypothetical protein